MSFSSRCFKEFQVESTEAMMTAFDLLGFHVRLKTPDGMRGARIALSHKVRNASETRKVFVEMVQHAQLAHRTSHIPSEIAVFRRVSVIFFSHSD
jgi:hypothetical protein